jgi:hypothetical protein
VWVRLDKRDFRVKVDFVNPQTPKKPREKDIIEKLAGIFLDRKKSQRHKMILHAALFWFFSVVLCAMILDGGVIGRRYLLASFGFWPAMLFYISKKSEFTFTESAVFRALPFLFFIFSLFVGTALMIFGR